MLLGLFGAKHQEVSKNLSNIQKFIDKSIVMSSKLGDLWNNGNFSSRQKLQKLVFPEGVLFDKEINDYRTENVNEVFEIFRRFTVLYEDEKQKAITDFHQLSPCVGMRRLERPTPTSRT